jgi:uncharacterized protein (DUF1800 family)
MKKYFSFIFASNLVLNSKAFEDLIPCDEGNLGGGLVFLEKSSTGSLCTLVKVNSNDSSIIPIGRSYNGGDWENTAGAFSNIPFSCEPFCGIELPSLANGDTYRLAEFTHSISQQEELARFLDQSTFGVTRKDLLSFDEEFPTDVSIASWIQNQIDNVEITSHRAWFRKHSFHHFPRPSKTMRPLHSCEVNNKWRKYALNSNDLKRALLIKNVSGKIIISLDGQIRTIVESIDWNKESYVTKHGSLNTENNRYFICRVSDCLSCTLSLRDPKTSSCQAVRVNGIYGNPLVDFNSTIMSSDRVLELSDKNVQPVGNHFFSGKHPQELITVKQLNDTLCTEFAEEPIFGFHTGLNAYYLSSPPPALLENDVSSPDINGGGNSVALTHGQTKCSNAPRTQFNEHSCLLSYDNEVCNNKPDNIEIILNHDSLQTFYNTTQANSNGKTRYVFAIDGLFIDSKSKTVSPCTLNGKSRWIPIPNNPQCESNSLSAASEEFLASLILSSNDINPYVRDIKTFYEGCDIDDKSKKDFEINVNGICWKHVHQHHLNVYDMTYWAEREIGKDYPPGAREFAENGQTIIQFQESSTKNWHKKSRRFQKLGRLGDAVSFADLHKELKINSIESTFREKIPSQHMIVCGSPDEVANEPTIGGGLSYGAFGFASEVFRNYDDELSKSRKTVMTMIAIHAIDQLRQRQAWALSQIVTIASPSIEHRSETEKRVAYTDILVRNAFKSYRDILKEISFSPLMGENLSYINSKSVAYNWETQNKLIYPAENYAREIMQLYSLGLCMLNPDGSEIIADDGNCVPVYTNNEIFEYSRVWTGFQAQPLRGNIETVWEEGNHNDVDPLKIERYWRDKFPKMGLNGNYIGDGYPLCVDRPKHHFLRRNAKYRLLGSSSIPELQTDPDEWKNNELVVRLTLSNPQENGPYLYNELCNSSGNESCNFKNIVIIESDLSCFMNECDIDTVRVVQIQDVFYEYISQPCVEQAFFNDAKKIVTKDYDAISCANPKREVASSACCVLDESTLPISAILEEKYWGERMTHESALNRCENMNYSLCQFPVIQGCGRSECSHNPYFWTNAGCSLRVKVNPDDGKVAILYHANDDNSLMTKHVQSDSPSYFPVHWNNTLFPSPNNNCDDSPLCEIINESCVCTIGVNEVQVFDEMPTRNQVIERLDIGSFDPSALGLNKYVVENNVTMFYEDESNRFKTSSVFKVVDEFGRERLFKNVLSTVKIVGSSQLFSFRNPPHFMNLVDPEARDAYFETDAAIDQYFYHQNAGPFLAVNLMKHFGISNPSPNYILRVSTAFKRGVYSWTSKTTESSFEFGSRMYGDLAATTASILLDTESRDPVLDVDPTHGSLLEPILKIYKLMRSMEIEARDSEFLLEFNGLTNKIGQDSYEIPSVFNFFLPEFQPSGLIQEASLVAPEAQLITGPNVLGLLNGMFALIKYGMNSCYGGFFPGTSKSCKADPGNYDASRGRLTYSPSDDSDSDAVINELSTLLTGGRLCPENKQIIKDVYDNESDKAAALIMAQQLIVTSAEFHTSGGTVKKSGAARLKASTSQPSEEPYKAVVFILLSGGFDSFNMLVPRCEPLKTKYNVKRGILALNDDELSDEITVPLQNNQPCSNFAIHYKLPVLHEMYSKAKVLFFANTGALDQK